MPPTLLLIRHAQALHNITRDWTIHDAPLSKIGEHQSSELQESLQSSEIGNKVELIVVSAMRRTLQTASIGLDFLIQKGIPVLPSANWQENSDKPCDTGSDLSTMKSEFPQFDFSLVDPTYPDKTSNPATNLYAFTEKAIIARGQACLRDLYHRPEKVIAVVSHSGFLRCGISNRSFFNADWRVFEFDEERMRGSKEKGEERFILKEWEETEAKGGGMGRSEKGTFGIQEGDFPPVAEAVKAQPEKVGEVEEVVKEKPET